MEAELNKIKNKKLVLFGASKYGEEVLKYLNTMDLQILCFIDNDKNKWGTLYHGYKVISIDELINQEYDFIIVTSMYAADIYFQLKEYNVEKDKIILSILSRIREPVGNLNIATDKSVIKDNEFQFEANKIIFSPGEKIRIVIIFQIASFWPSLESLYEEMMVDERFEVKIYLFNERIVEAKQIESARDYLIDNSILFEEYAEEKLDEYRPHIVILQSPYDYTHRIESLYSSNLKRKGYRVMYVPYGIEISDTEQSREVHFNNHVVLNSWRVYTFSDYIIKDYNKYSHSQIYAIKALGHPKFDKIYNYKKNKLDKKIIEEAKGRKIVLWKLHFPKEFKENNTYKMATPNLEEYYRFSKIIENYNDLFFIVMAHPKFIEMCPQAPKGYFGLEMMRELEEKENVYCYTDDDYVPGLMHSDLIMIDRSSLMVEAAAVGKPILYLTNEEYYEPVTEAIEELIDSYYKGTGYAEMIKFVDMCVRGEDPKKEERRVAFEKCIPYFDGKVGWRIKKDIIKSIMQE